MREKLDEKLKLKETTAAQLPAVANPYAQESEWLPVCTQKQMVGRSTVRAAKRTMMLLLALIASGIAAIAGNYAVQLGYDWGYRVVELMIGSQPTGSAQGMAAIESLFFLIMPMYFGLAFGCFRSVWSGSRPRTVYGLLTAFASVVVLAVLASKSMLTQGPIETAVWAVVAAFFGVVGLAISHYYYGLLRPRVRVRALVACATATIGLLAAAWALVSENSNFIVELLLYCLVIMTASAWAADFGRARHKSGAILLAFTASLPITLANLLNLLGNIICLVLDRFHVGPGLGWESLVSAAAINAIAIMSVTYGGLIGFWLFQKKPDRLALPSELLPDTPRNPGVD